MWTFVQRPPDTRMDVQRQKGRRITAARILVIWDSPPIQQRVNRGDVSVQELRGFHVDTQDGSPWCLPFSQLLDRPSWEGGREPLPATVHSPTVPIPIKEHVSFP